VEQADVVASSRIAIVEMHSAVARMRAAPDPRLTGEAHDSILDDMREFWRHLAVIELDDAVAHSAARLASTHVLRAYDAVHLAAALQLGQSEIQFYCWDLALREAAAEERLAVLPAA
jgi:predicted nucleic acid-binding protein